MGFLDVKGIYKSFGNTEVLRGVDFGQSVKPELCASFSSAVPFPALHCERRFLPKIPIHFSALPECVSVSAQPFGIRPEFHK